MPEQDFVFTCRRANASISARQTVNYTIEQNATNFLLDFITPSISITLIPVVIVVVII